MSLERVTNVNTVLEDAENRYHSYNIEAIDLSSLASVRKAAARINSRYQMALFHQSGH